MFRGNWYDHWLFCMRWRYGLLHLFIFGYHFLDLIVHAQGLKEQGLVVSSGLNESLDSVLRLVALLH
jgi:hypothetical protein